MVVRLRFCAVLGWAVHLLVVSLAEKSRGLFLVRGFTVRDCELMVVVVVRLDPAPHLCPPTT